MPPRDAAADARWYSSSSTAVAAAAAGSSAKAFVFGQVPVRKNKSNCAAFPRGALVLFPPLYLSFTAAAAVS